LVYDSSRSKLVDKRRRRPRNIQFEELDRFLRQIGLRSRQRGPSHVVDKRDDGSRLTVTTPHGGRNTVSAAAIADVLAMLDEMETRDAVVEDR